MHKQARDTQRVLWFDNLIERNVKEYRFIVLNSEEQAYEEETYAKSLVGNRTTKILGTPWDKQSDTLRFDFETCLKTAEPLTKRKMISVISSVYDIPG